MIEVGVKDLKNGLSSYLRRVARGEHVRITMRGRPVADIVPAGRPQVDDPELLRLDAAGKLTLSRLPQPTKPPALVEGRGSASAYVLGEREEDRV